MCRVLAQRQVNVSSVGSETGYCVKCWLRQVNVSSVGSETG